MMIKGFLSIACLLSVSAVYAQTPQQIVQKFYPKYSNEYQCYRVSDKQLGGEYCVRQIKSETRQTAQGKQMYLLFAGSKLDFTNGEENGSHADSGFAGVFVLKQKAENDWQLAAALPESWAGAFGNAPAAKDWSFHQFGQDKWGFMTRHSDVHQGYAGSAYVLFHYDGGQSIGRSLIASAADNSGALGDCRFNRQGRKANAAERRECLNSLHDLSSTIKIAKSGKTVKGFYPLQISVSGFDGRKQYRNQTFTVPYHAGKKQYIAPKNYPLNNKEF